MFGPELLTFPREGVQTGEREPWTSLHVERLGPGGLA